MYQSEAFPGECRIWRQSDKNTDSVYLGVVLGQYWCYLIKIQMLLLMSIIPGSPGELLLIAREMNGVIFHLLFWLLKI